jgi:DNA-binding NtrC family response regulator
LRERREDIAPLAQHFLWQQLQRYRKNLDGFDVAATQAMLKYDWPGNVRELEHTIERAVLMATGPAIRAADLGLRTASESSSSIEELSLEEVEALLIKKSLARCDGNVSRAAESLGLSRSALYRRLEKYGL